MLNSNKFQLFWPLLLIAFIAIITGLGSWLQDPPNISGNIGVNDFSAKRAQTHVSRIAKQPHPAGSVANAYVRKYLVKTLQNMGAEVDIQKKLQTYDYKPRAGRARFANVENVIARFSGEVNESALLLMSHYDSVPDGPGAGDNASGVATTLETIRVLKNLDLPMRNTLIVLFTDAEEVGLMGAQSFFGHHPWADQVELVLNLDSRGSSGPVFMYETSPENGSLIDSLGKIAPFPLANSMIYAIFQKISNFSDFSISTLHGKAGMNFAFIDGFYAYHGPMDKPQSLSLQSLGHMGSYALSLARHFGGVELPLVSQPNRHYFNLVGHVFVSYPPWLDWIVFVLILILLILNSIKSLNHGSFSVLQLLQGFVSASVLIAIPVLVIVLSDQIFDQIRTTSEVLARQRSWFVSWSLIGIGLTFWLSSLFSKKRSWPITFMLAFLLVILSLIAGGQLWLVAFGLGVLLTLMLRVSLIKEARIIGALWLLVLFSLAMLWQLQGGAHVLTWPLLVILIAYNLRWFKFRERNFSQVLLLFVGLPATILLGMTALNFDLFIGYAVPIASVSPLLLLLLFYLPLIVCKSASVTGLGVFLIGVIGIFWLTVNEPWTANKPLEASLFILHDANLNTNYWATNNEELTDWHHAVLGTAPIIATSELFQSAAPEKLWLAPNKTAVVAAPYVELIETNKEQGLLRFRLKPDQAGDTVTLWLRPESNLFGWHVEGQPLQFDMKDSDKWRSVTGFAMPQNGVELTLNLAADSNWPELLLVGVSPNFPNGVQNLNHQSNIATVKSTVAFRNIVVDDL